jgi:hypothetical protein
MLARLTLKESGSRDLMIKTDPSLSRAKLEVEKKSCPNICRACCGNAFIHRFVIIQRFELARNYHALSALTTLPIFCYIM